MMQGLIAGWILILSLVALIADDNLRHAIPDAFGDFLAVAIIGIPIWVPILLYSMHKKKEAKRQVVEIEVGE